MKIEDENNRRVSLVYVLLLCSGKHSYLPELYDIFGEDKTMEMLEVFAGTTIKFPGLLELKTLARNVVIYLTLRKLPSKWGEKSTAIEELSSTYGMDPAVLMQRYDETKRLIEKELKLRFV